PNFNPATHAQLTPHLSFTPTPVQIFDYVYAILHDPLYRARFNEYLKRDFPRVPIPAAPVENPGDFHITEKMFHVYIQAGEQLRKLHLMQAKHPAPLRLDPATPDNLQISAIKYKDGILHLNPEKRLHGIPAKVWAFRIGGYQVLDKWFKSHKGTEMDYKNFDHIAHVVGLLAKTIEIQARLKQLHE
ncbi:MAG: hypothetical protein FWC07_12275, partial [Defluviitaleaceae bacterium]|nr:hypothetical protein [Defluviitaleaceae bacterium]